MVYKKNCKAQNEIVGLVVIVMLVIVIGVIFLALSISKGNTVQKTSVEISDFMQSSMHYTTECAKGFIPNYHSLQDLIKSCYRNEKCLDGKESCSVLNETFKKILSESFQVSETGGKRGYQVEIYYKDLNEDMPDEPILKIDEGVFANCTSSVGASQSVFIDNGNINIDLNLCYKN